MAKEVGISRKRVENILHNELGMSKVSARSVPRLLTPDQKRIRMVMSRANLAIFEANPDGFCKHFVTEDRCWVHHFESVDHNHKNFTDLTKSLYYLSLLHVVFLTMRMYLETCNTVNIMKV